MNVGRQIKVQAEAPHIVPSAFELGIKQVSYVTQGPKLYGSWGYPCKTHGNPCSKGQGMVCSQKQHAGAHAWSSRVKDPRFHRPMSCWIHGSMGPCPRRAWRTWGPLSHGTQVTEPRGPHVSLINPWSMDMNSHGTHLPRVSVLWFDTPITLGSIAYIFHISIHINH